MFVCTYLYLCIYILCVLYIHILILYILILLNLLHLTEANRITAHFKVYQNIRIAKLKAELKQQESTYSSQWLAAQQDGPYDKSSHPFKEYFTLSYWLLRSELQLWGSTLPSNQESLEVFVNICDALISSIEKVLAPILLDEKSKIGNPVVRKVW